MITHAISLGRYLWDFHGPLKRRKNIERSVFIIEGMNVAHNLDQTDAAITNICKQMIRSVQIGSWMFKEPIFISCQKGIKSLFYTLALFTLSSGRYARWEKTQDIEDEDVHELASRIMWSQWTKCDKEDCCEGRDQLIADYLFFKRPGQHH